MTRPAISLLACIFAVAAAAPAAASPVLVLDGREARAADDPHLPAADLPAPPRGAGGRTAHARTTPAEPPGPTVRQELDRLLAEAQIDPAQHRLRVNVHKRARRALRRLTGARRTELAAVLENAEAIAAAGQLTVSRLEPVFQTLERNTRYWTTGPLIAHGRRVVFDDAPTVWQYYRGQGLQIQVLANFGKANALWADEEEAQLRDLLGELVPLAADRGGSPAWEYYFRFGGGAPPWTSGLSQGTAVQALARASALLGDASYRDLAARALALFEQPPPTGVRVDTPAGAHYLIYTFSPSLLVLNAFLQSVIGLHDYAQLTGDPRGQALYAAGESEARQAVPRYDTGVWSLYSLEREADLGYHNLQTGFLRNLCTRTREPVYCDAAARFRGYLRTTPTVAVATRRIRTGAPAELGFQLDKISRVGVSVLSGGTTVFATSAVVGRGLRTFRWPRPAAEGVYELRVTATDLAGNRSQATGTLRVLPPRRKPRPEEPAQPPATRRAVP